MNPQAIISYDPAERVFTVIYTDGTRTATVKYGSLETLLGALRDIYAK